MPVTAYRNPVIPGFNPDPTVIRVGEDFFLVTSSFEYFPGLPIYHSKDLTSWNLIGHALTRPSQLDLRTCEGSSGVFAPTLRFHEGRYYITVCALHKKAGEGPGLQIVPPRGFYVSTEDIWDSSSWSDPIYYDVLGIDQDLFFDKTSGKAFLSWANYCDDSTFDRPKGMAPIATFITEIDITTGRQTAPQRLLRYSKAGSGVCEGPHIFIKDGTYYLSTAEGGTELGHQQWICRSKESPYGPWEIGPEDSVNPMIFNNEHPEVRQTGHMDIVEGADGRWWAVFLATRTVYEDGKALPSPLGRETFLAPMEWVDGWPVVNKREPITVNGLATSGLSRSDERVTWDLTFSPDRDIYCDGWYHLRTPLKQEHDLTTHPGSLTLWGGPYSLEVDECPTMLLQKQPDFISAMSLVLDFKPLLSQSSAGVVVWWSRYAYASLRVRGVKSKKGAVERELVFREPNLEGDNFVEKVSAFPGEGSVRLTIRTEPNKYTFFAAAADSNSLSQSPRKEEQLGSITSRSLVRTRKFDSMNTGTLMGVFAHGADSESCIAPAIFGEISLSATRAGGT